MYFSSFYNYKHPPPVCYERHGRYDIGCGGYCDWYITKELICADNFCVKYPCKNYVFIFDPYDKENLHSKIYRQFINKFPDYCSIHGIWYIAFSDSSRCIPEASLDPDEGGGNIYEIDLHRDRSTFSFDSSGNPIWKTASPSAEN
jgi:hypothetical protein